MKLVFFFFIFLLFIIFINNKREFFSNKREFFSNKIIGDLAYEDYEVNDEKISKLFSDNFLSPKKLNYSVGTAGIGVGEEVNTISFDVENVKSVIPEAIKKVGDKEITNLEAIVPVMMEGVKKNFNNINQILVDFEQLKADMMDLKKYNLEKIREDIDMLKKK